MRTLPLSLLVGMRSIKNVRISPRVRVLHPMPWSDYLSLTANRTMDIGLAPLLDNSFNKARSHTKFLDICRQSAVGIYSDHFPLSNDIKRHNAGTVLSNNPECWALAIERLAMTDREPIRKNARAT